MTETDPPPRPDSGASPPGKRRLVVATHNRGKLREVREILGEDFEVWGADEMALPEVDETGETFEENALLKARAALDTCGAPVLADDSGLEVDALDGRPGVRSARYGGPGLDDAGRRRRLLEELKGVPEERRTARFVCVLALALPGEPDARTVHGVCEGRIALEERGDGGFGYDPIFIPEGHEQSFGELGAEVKHALSHRGAALRKMAPSLRTLR